jgi:hypothetical protein
MVLAKRITRSPGLYIRYPGLTIGQFFSDVAMMGYFIAGRQSARYRYNQILRWDGGWMLIIMPRQIQKESGTNPEDAVYPDFSL